MRCNLLRTLLQEDFRGFSCQLAGNPLYQRFCGIDALDLVRVPSKSELQRFACWQNGTQMRSVIDRLLQEAIQQPAILNLAHALNLEDYFLDTTCLQANIQQAALPDAEPAHLKELPKEVEDVLMRPQAPPVRQIKRVASIPRDFIAAWSFFLSDLALLGKRPLPARL